MIADNAQTNEDVFEAVTFPVPLKEGIPSSNVIYTPSETPVAHCSGPGHADKGFLCIYVDAKGKVKSESVGNFEGGGGFYPGTGRFGFAAFWVVKENGEAWADGAWTVTAN